MGEKSWPFGSRASSQPRKGRAASVAGTGGPETDLSGRGFMKPSWSQLAPSCPSLIYAAQELFQAPSPQLPSEGIDRPNGPALRLGPELPPPQAFLWPLISGGLETPFHKWGTGAQGALLGSEGSKRSTMLLPPPDSLWLALLLTQGY